MKRVAIALIAVLALTGCTEIGSIADKAQIDLGLAQLASDLEQVPGVTGVESHAELQGDYSYAISIGASAETLSDSALHQVGVIAMEQLGAGVFGRHHVTFSVGSETGTQLGMNRFTGIDLDGELDYLAQLSAAYGAPLAINFYDETRQISSLAPSASPDWEAMRAIPDDSALERSWYFDALASMGELPDASATDLADALRAIVPLASGLSLDISGVDVTLMDASYSDLSAPESSPNWPVALQVAAVVSASPLAVPHLAYYGDGSSGFAVAYRGPCTVDDLVVTPEDEALATALAAALGDARWGGGYCPVLS